MCLEHTPQADADILTDRYNLLVVGAEGHGINDPRVAHQLRHSSRRGIVPNAQNTGCAASRYQCPIVGPIIRLDCIR